MKAIVWKHVTDPKTRAAIEADLAQAQDPES